MRNVLIAAAVLASATASGAQPGIPATVELDRLIGDRVAGTPVDCIDLRRVQWSRIVNGTAIVYKHGSTIYVNQPRNGAEMLDRRDLLAFRLIGRRLCSVDPVRLIDRGSRTLRGVITLGEFVPYRRLGASD